VTESLAIAQVSPVPWDAPGHLAGQVRLIANGLAKRGHQVVVLAPGRSAGEAAAGRRTVSAAKRSGSDLLPQPGGKPVVIHVGEALGLSGRTRRSLPAGAARALEDVLETLELDVVHLHEPLPGGVSGAALRFSRALNIGHFHRPQPRFPATDVGRRVGGALYGRLDACIADYATALPAIREVAPANAEVVLPSLTTADHSPDPAGDVLITQVVGGERSALRTTLRALRKLPAEGWRARIAVQPGSPPPASIGSEIRDRVEIVEVDAGGEEAFLSGSDIVVIGGTAAAPRPVAVLAALAVGAVPVATTVPVHELLLEDGRLGPCYGVGDHQTLAAQLTTALAKPDRVAKWRGEASSLRGRLDETVLLDRIESTCAELVSRRHDVRARPDLAALIAERPLIDVDLHMHTDHSYDCATPVEVLLAEARAKGLGAIAVTDHNEVSGAIDAAEKASGIKIIISEEIKTADQGEVIGLFIQKRIPPGMTLRETLDAIHAQGGLAYVPHPFDRMHSVPDYEHLLAEIDRIDAIEVYNARIAVGEFNEEAARFASKYRLPAGAGLDSHVAQGLGSVRIRMRDFDGPEEFLESLRQADIVRSPSSLFFVQALKFIQTKATPTGARAASKRRRVRKAARKS
jgi:hypothetical protein